MRKALLAALLIAVSLVLSACSISVGGGGGTDLDDEVDATTRAQATVGTDDLAAEPAAVGRVTLAAGEERLYLVTVPEVDEDGLFVYADAEIDLWLYRANERLYGTSHSPDFFAEGSAGLAMRSSGTAMSPQVVVSQTCPGSCVIANNPGEGHVYVRVRNDSGTSRTFGLWAVLRPFADGNEAYDEFDPEPFTGNSEGALETLGDIDYYIVDDTGGSLAFDATTGSGIDFVAEISDPRGPNPTRTIRPGESAEVYFDEEIRVYAENRTERAAVSGNSEFFLYY